MKRTSELHAFHSQQIHFVVEEQSRGNAPPGFADTVSVPYAMTHAGRMDPIITGTFVFHCHILEHEDGGMMQ